MKIISKKVKISDAEKIIKFYTIFNTNWFPKLIKVDKNQKHYSFDFEWIDGKIINKLNLEKAFFQLGKMHIKNKISDDSYGFQTLCHGDFHQNNIIQSTTLIKFIDVTYLNIGWNFSDFDYVDFYEIFEPKKYPWILQNNDFLNSYNEGAGIIMSLSEIEKLKKKIMIRNLTKYISNGKKYNLPVSFEERELKKIIFERENLQGLVSTTCGKP